MFDCVRKVVDSLVCHKQSKQISTCFVKFNLLARHLVSKLVITCLDINACNKCSCIGCNVFVIAMLATTFLTQSNISPETPLYYFKRLLRENNDMTSKSFPVSIKYKVGHYIKIGNHVKCFIEMYFRCCYCYRFLPLNSFPFGEAGLPLASFRSRHCWISSSFILLLLY